MSFRAEEEPSVPAYDIRYSNGLRAEFVKVQGVPGSPGPLGLPRTGSRLRISDVFGNSVETDYYPGRQVVLPPVFDPLPAQPASNPQPLPNTAAMFADTAAMAEIKQQAPGHVLVIRRNGKAWIDISRGYARVDEPGVSARAMTADTIISIASMSKPVTATAVVAMMDDWAKLRAEVQTIGLRGAPRAELRVRTGGVFATIDVPTVLVPLFSDRARAQAVIGSGLPPRTPDRVRRALDAFVAGTLTVRQPLEAPPGFFGLLKRVVLGQAPGYDLPVLPLIRERLGQGNYDPVAATRTVAQFLLHSAGFTDNGLDRTYSEPAGGRATFDYWGLVRTAMTRPPGPAVRSYFNVNYDVLTCVVEACTETSFDDYLRGRLFHDPRFDCIRRRVVDTPTCALYYAGTGPAFANGVVFSDYTDWTGDGGLYVTGRQFTDWLHALFAGEPLAQRGRPAAPLVSAEGHEALFGASQFFCGDTAQRFTKLTPTTRRYQHNGGVGRLNGNIAIIVAKGGTIYTGFYAANSDLAADDPWNAVVDALVWDDRSDLPRPADWLPPGP